MINLCVMLLIEQVHKKVSGGDDTGWSTEEELSLMGLLCSNNYFCKNFANFEWTEAVDDLNRLYGNHRSIAVCKSQITQQKIREAISQKLI